MSLWCYFAVVVFFLATPVARAARVLNISQTNESTPRLCHTTPDPAKGHRPPPSPALLCGSHPSTSQARQRLCRAGLSVGAFGLGKSHFTAVLSSQHIQRLLELSRMSYPITQWN
ncbi:hypothetical protein V8C42DRAFT_231110 [Trichoderma barbatum]